MRRAAKVDASQAAIVAALRDAGASVQSLAAVGDGCPDLLVGHAGRTVLLEVKEPHVKGKLRPSQVDWHLAWMPYGGPLFVVETPEQALRVMGMDHDLSF